MNEEELREQEQMRKLMTFRKIAQGIVGKYLVLLGIVLAIAFAVVLTLIVRRVRNSPERYEASTTLVFAPKSASRIKPMEPQEALHVITRYTMFKKLADALQLTPGERARLASDIEVAPERGQRSLFSIKALGATEAIAVRKINAFADLCIREYSAYRTADLENWLETILLRKREVQEMLEKNDAEESELCRKYGVTKPAAEADRLTVAISERKAELSEAKVRLGGYELKRKKVESDLSKVPAEAVEHADEIRRHMARLAVSEKELADLHRQYTDKNPRLLLRNEQYEREKAEFSALLTALGVSNVSLTAFDKMGTLKDELKDVEAKLELVREGIAATEREIERLTRQLQSLLEVMPEFDRLAHQRENLRASLESVEDGIADVRYLESAVRNDLTQVERAQFATGKNPMSVKALAVAALAGFVVAGLLAFVILVFEYAFGRVLSVGELACQPELLPLGALPPGGKFTSETEEKAVLDGIFYRFRNAEKDWGCTFFACLPGAERPTSLAAAFSWNFAMCGIKLIAIRLVPAQGFLEPEGAEVMTGVVCSGHEAWFPVADISALSPGELSLLSMDVKALRKRGFAVGIILEEPIRSGELVTAQLLDLCDSVGIAVGVKRTRREDLRKLLALPRRHPERRIPFVATGVTNAKSLKEGNFR